MFFDTYIALYSLYSHVIAHLFAIEMSFVREPIDLGNLHCKLMI